MWLNKNKNNEVIHKPKGLTIGGIQYPSNIFSKWSEAELNAIGLYTILATGTYNRRYYESEKVEDFNVVPPTIGYIKTDKPVDDVKATMLKDLEKVANDKFDDAVAGYTAGEMSSWAELEADAIKHQTIPLVSGMLFDEATISGITVDELATKVLTNANAFKQVKSYVSGTRKKKSLEIEALITVADCVLYEATPYDYIITAEDVANDIDGTFILGTVVTRLKNRVTDWS